MYKFLFPNRPDTIKASMLILAARIIFGTLLLSHGVQKLIGFQELASVFPDPLGVGSSTSLMLAIFAELLCSIGFILGFLYRLALIPMIFTMGMAFFVIHGHDPFAIKELALVYLAIFLLAYIVGPGIFSIDSFLAKKLNKSHKAAE